MRKFLMIFVSSILLLCATAPWLLTSCQPSLLLPEELSEKKSAYESTVDAAQVATSEAMRQAQSIVNIEPVRTLAVAESSPVQDGADVSQQSRVIVSTVTPPGFSVSSEPTVETIVISTSTVMVIPTLSIPTEITAVSTNIMPPTPFGMIDVEDTLTEEMLAEVLKQDEAGDDLTDVHVFIFPEGIKVTAKFDVIIGIKQDILAMGTFAVENDNLVVKIQSIELEKVDVTQLYKKKVESRVVTGVYKLLPRRYVQDFTLRNGEIVVYSKMRP